jgi:tetratricopeptide (TPR) repeat protein
MSDAAPPDRQGQPRLLRDPTRLRQRIDALVAGMYTGRVTGAELAALAEAYFRLGMDPDRPPDEALLLLRYAVACDEANPKFAYHLGRRYLLHGELDRAATWLRRALAAAPSSHRLWVHASLLQLELDDRYRRDSRFEPMALRRRSRAVLERVRAGDDRIDPALLEFEPPSRSSPDAGWGSDAVPEPPAAGSTPAPPRLLEPGRCRWAGADDLAAEELLREPPSEQNRDRLLELLGVAERRRATRRGGDAALAILAVSWVVGGYPVAAARRLLPPTGVPRRPSLDLLELVCDLYEVEEDRLPDCIAAVVRSGRLPPYVAALIHCRRLLGEQLGHPQLGRAYRAARAFLAGEDPDDATAAWHARELSRAASILAVAPTAPIPDVSTEPTGDPAARLADLAEEAERLTSRLEGQLARLRRLAKNPAGCSPADQAEIAEASTMIQMVDAACESGLAEVAAARDAGIDDLPAEFGASLEQWTQTFQRAPERLGSVRRYLSAIRQKAATGDLAPPSPSDGPQRDEQVSGRAALEAALRDVDRELGDRYGRAEAMLDRYPPDIRSSPPMRGLRRLVHSRHAETWYRVGDSNRARALWSRVVREDRLDPRALKNLATLATIEGDRSHGLEAWRTYCETLYELAILARNPRVRAKERAGLHRHLGGAYAPASLAVRPDAEEPVEAPELSVISFLGNRIALRIFVGHTLLQYLNAKLDFTSPSLLLGVALDDDEETVSASRTALRDLVLDACPALPARIRQPFQALALERVETAHRDVRSTRSATLRLDPMYSSELGRHLQWLEGICRFKLQLEAMVHRHLVAYGRRWSLDFLDELALLDGIPLAAGPGFLPTVQRRLRLAYEPKDLAETFTKLQVQFGRRRPPFRGAVRR